MKGLKKSSNKKFNVVIIYGAPAVGKFTVAKELSKKLNYKLLHNHDLKDFIWKFFPRGTYSDHFLFEKFILLLVEQAAKNRMDLIFTNTHSLNFVSQTGLTNVGFYKKIEKVVKKYGGNMAYVQLIADPKAIVKRVDNNDRKLHRKLTNKKIMREVLKEKDWFSPTGLNGLVLDTTNTPPQKISNLIVKHFGLKK